MALKYFQVEVISGKMINIETDLTVKEFESRIIKDQSLRVLRRVSEGHSADIYHTLILNIVSVAQVNLSDLGLTTKLHTVV